VSERKKKKGFEEQERRRRSRAEVGKCEAMERKEKNREKETCA
jgi:hypothetical protein